MSETQQSVFCSQCGKSFKNQHGRSVHQSRVHGTPTVECSNCGEEFEKPRNKIEKYDNHFCSRTCKGEFRSKKIKTECAHCGAELMRTPNELKRVENSYCDKSCSAKGERTRPVPFKLEPRPVWKRDDGVVAIHQLVAIANGADAHKVFSGGEYHVHHKNGCRVDNRPINIELLSRSEHMQEEGEKWSDIERYTTGDIISAIAFMMNPAENLNHVE